MSNPPSDMWTSCPPGPSQNEPGRGRTRSRRSWFRIAWKVRARAHRSGPRTNTEYGSAGAVVGLAQEPAHRLPHGGLLAAQERALDLPVRALGVRPTDVDDEAVERTPREIDDYHGRAVPDGPELAALPDPPGPAPEPPGPPGAGAGDAGARGHGVVAGHHPRPHDALEGHIEPPGTRCEEVDAGALHPESGGRHDEA